MATANDVIRQALRRIGALASGETPTASESNDALQALNALIDSWQIENLIVPQRVIEAHTVSGSSFTIEAHTVSGSSFTIGASGDLATSRPVRVAAVYSRLNGIDYPATIIGRAAYNNIPQKTTTTSSYPDRVFYDDVYPNGVLYVYPVPITPITLFIDSYKAIQPITDAAAVIDLPPEYQRLMVLGLCRELSPEYGLPVDQLTFTEFDKLLRKIKSHNFTAVDVSSPLGKGRRYNIYSE